MTISAIPRPEDVIEASLLEEALDVLAGLMVLCEEKRLKTSPFIRLNCNLELGMHG